MDCCEFNYIGIYCHNEIIDTGLVANQTGKHTIRIDNLGTFFSFEIDCTVYFPIVFPDIDINEDQLYKFEIIQPDGIKYELNGLTCFAFRNVINMPNDWDTNTYLCI